MLEGETGVWGRFELSSEAGELPADGVEGMVIWKLQKRRRKLCVCLERGGGYKVEFREAKKKGCCLDEMRPIREGISFRLVSRVLEGCWRAGGEVDRKSYAISRRTPLDYGGGSGVNVGLRDVSADAL